MAERGRPKAPLVLTEEERQTLQRWSRRSTTAQALALRCRIVLACAEGQTNQAVAEQLGVWPQTVAKWRGRFVRQRLEGLSDEPRPGRPRMISDEQVEQVLTKTLEEPPPHHDTHWSTRSMARATGMSQTAISRIWRAFGLKPHLQETWKLSTDPQFIDKVRDVVGLYLDPPEAALVLCVDEKRARSRRWTALRRACRCCPPPRPGAPTTTCATAPPACSPPWMWPAAR
jgi:transposase